MVMHRLSTGWPGEKLGLSARQYNPAHSFQSFMWSGTMRTTLRNQRLRTCLWGIIIASAAAFSQPQLRTDGLGVPVSTPEALNSNAAGDSGTDVRPRIACNETGRCVAVWASNENLNSSIGIDYDILVSCPSRCLGPVRGLKDGSSPRELPNVAANRA